VDVSRALAFSFIHPYPSIQQRRMSL